MKIAAMLQARMGSSRFPGKSLLPIAGRSMLELLVERVRTARRLDDFWLATSVDPGDDVLAATGRKLGINVFRGSEADVLDRLVNAAQAAGAQAVVDLTGDNPFVDARLVDAAVALYQTHGPDCYVHSDYERHFPLGYVCQVYSLAAMRQALAASTPATPYREHPNLFIYRHPELYPPVSVPVWPGAQAPEVRLTVDYPEDYQLAKAVFEAPGVDPVTLSVEEVVAFLAGHDAIAGRNAHCRQHRPDAADCTRGKA